MRGSRPQPIRNKLDLTDRAQVRLIKKRLKLSETQLTAIVGRVGNSLLAISKEAELQSAPVLPSSAEAAEIGSTTGEQTTAKAAASPPAS